MSKSITTDYRVEKMIDNIVFNFDQNRHQIVDFGPPELLIGCWRGSVPLFFKQSWLSELQNGSNMAKIEIPALALADGRYLLRYSALAESLDAHAVAGIVRVLASSADIIAHPPPAPR